MSLPEAIYCLDRLRSLSNLAFTPDGGAVLATVHPASSDRDDPQGSRIWRFGRDGTATQLTQGPHADSAARPAPRGDSIAFISDRLLPGKAGLFVLDGQGDARPIGDVPGTIEAFHWRADGLAIVALAADRGLNGGATNGATRLRWGDAEDPEVTSPARARRRLLEIELATGASREVGPRDLTVWEFVLVPGGAVAVVSADPSERGWHHPKLARIDFASRATTIVHETDWQVQGLAADPAGGRVAFLEGWSSDRGLVAGAMRVLDLQTGVATTLAADELSNVTQLIWRDADSLWFAGWQGLGSVFGIVSTAGTVSWSTTEAATLGENPFVASLAVAPDGRSLAAIRETAGRPQELFFKPRETEPWQQLSRLNTAVADTYPDYPEIRHLTWQGKDGLALESFVLIPKGVTAPAPMVVDIHGGPCMSMKHGFNPGGALAFAAAGYVVFVPNYRGNVGWGQAFTRMNLGDPAAAEFDDILAGVDRCIELGLADPDRIGVTGASYGGYLSAWAVAATDRFKAAIPISSICDQLSCHYSCEHDFHEFINGGTLRQQRYRDIAVERSPIHRLDRPTTPTLLIHGADDRCTPLGQAQQFYAALCERGVEAELVVYPREGHGLHERAHKFDSLQRQLDWFDRHLRGGAVA